MEERKTINKKEKEAVILNKFLDIFNRIYNTHLRILEKYREKPDFICIDERSREKRGFELVELPIQNDRARWAGNRWLGEQIRNALRETGKLMFLKPYSILIFFHGDKRPTKNKGKSLAEELVDFLESNREEILDLKISRQNKDFRGFERDNHPTLKKHIRKVMISRANCMEPLIDFADVSSYPDPHRYNTGFLRDKILKARKYNKNQPNDLIIYVISPFYSYSMCFEAIKKVLKQATDKLLTNEQSGKNFSKVWLFDYYEDSSRVKICPIYPIGQ